MTRIQVLERFVIKGRGEVAIYHLLQSQVRLGMVLVSEMYQDAWRVVSDQDQVFIIPLPEGGAPPLFCLLRPLGSSRTIEVGEVFVETTVGTDETAGTT